MNLANDLDDNQSKWVIVNHGAFLRTNGPDFNIFTYLLTNQRFKSAWSHYELVTSYDEYSIYQRKKEGSST